MYWLSIFIYLYFKVQWFWDIVFHIYNLKGIWSSDDIEITRLYMTLNFYLIYHLCLVFQQYEEQVQNSLLFYWVACKIFQNGVLSSRKRYRLSSP